MGGNIYQPFLNGSRNRKKVDGPLKSISGTFEILILLRLMGLDEFERKEVAAYHGYFPPTKYEIFTSILKMRCVNRER
jgi:hypothetical protein